MKALLKEISAIVDNDLPLVSNLANISALLYKLPNINWAGFYMVENDKCYLGPFQGDVACTTILKGKGVVGTCLERKTPIIVDDVNKFKGHIACSSLSKSEIVIPVLKDDEVKLIIDLDAPIYSRFTTTELEFLLEVKRIIEDLL